ncbi:MAG: hypothetical protein IPJ88_04650 [Myxococcales bacterium]|nr:MAG: hypothetical protein IPJ88_04650 [Myxococcales bacterium]
MKNLVIFITLGALLLSSCTFLEDAGGRSDPLDPYAKQTVSFSAGSSFDFLISNLPLSTTVEIEPVDIVVHGRCTAGTNSGKICLDEVPYLLVEQDDPDRTKVGVFFLNSLTIEASGELDVVGDYPAMFVVLGDVQISGLITAIPDRFSQVNGRAGGASALRENYADGRGLGKGLSAERSSAMGAGGAAFCGKGGHGGNETSDALNGGLPYGNPSISPLLAGSTGGNGQYDYAGAGGGAIQIVSGTRIDVLRQGVINVSGAGGQWGASGGGSGGALLLEAPHISMQGTLAANGGGGAAGSMDGDGEAGYPSDRIALGGAKKSPGGSGGAAASADGEDGGYDSGSGGGGLDHLGGGGGGGAGWIRLNTVDGLAEVTGLVSPYITTGCTTLGVLLPLPKTD